MRNSKNNTYTIKKVLTNQEFADFVMIFTNSLFDPEINDNGVPYYILKSPVLNQLIAQFYCGITDEDVKTKSNEDLYALVEDVESSVNQRQYQDLLNSLDESIEYTIKLQFHESSFEQKLNNLIDKVTAFTDSLPTQSGEITALLNDHKPEIESILKFGNITEKTKNK